MVNSLVFMARSEDLTFESIELMREDWLSGDTYSNLSEKYSISKSAINNYVVSWNKGLDTSTELCNNFANNRGFENHYDYRKFLHYQKSDNIFHPHYSPLNSFNQRKF